MPPAKEVLAGLDPAPVWNYFAQLTAIPRPSKDEARVRDWVRNIAKQHGWSAREDQVGNVVFTVPASPGFEKADLLALQSHLDMVCEKNSDVQFDFSRDPLNLRIVGDEVRATGTTLGADNGIGVCAMLAVATSPDLRRPPLELVFTIDEETGLTGAAAISPELVRARRMINLDSEEDDILYIGCAGGRTSTLRFVRPLSPAGQGDAAATVSVSGLRGGHSGGEIHLGRANSNRLLARILRRATFPLRVASLDGGNKHNAIPREAAAVVLVARADLPKLRALAEAAVRELRAQFAEVDEGLACTVADRPGAAPAALSPEDSVALLDLVNALPDGVLGMSRAITGLVETSNNVAVVESKPADGRFEAMIVASSRSSSAPHLTAVLDQVAAAARLAGAKVATADGYPGWQPNPNSPLLEVCRRVYSQEFGVEPHVTAIHAGLECGVIGERVGGMDMISFGPTIRAPHSPDENVSIKSVQKFWRYLRAVLAALA